jgi:NADH dehydrogenase FAD-containing subunit
MGNAISDIHVVVIGSGYGGAAAARALEAKCRVTVIDPSDAFNHKIASLRGAVVPGWEKRVRIPLDNHLKHGKILRSNVKAVETGRVTLENDTVIECDYIILAHGRGRANFPCGKYFFFCVKSSSR